MIVTTQRLPTSLEAQNGRLLADKPGTGKTTMAPDQHGRRSP